MCLMLESCRFSYNKIEVVRYKNFTNQGRSHVVSVDINGALKYIYIYIYICLRQHKYTKYNKECFLKKKKKYNKECYLPEIWIAPQTKLYPFKQIPRYSANLSGRYYPQLSNRKSLPFWALWIRSWWEAIYTNTHNSLLHRWEWKQCSLHGTH